MFAKRSDKIPDRIPSQFLDRGSVMFYGFSNMTGVMVLEYDTPLDPARLQKAVELVLVAEPVLNSRFVRHFRKLSSLKSGDDRGAKHA